MFFYGLVGPLWFCVHGWPLGGFSFLDFPSRLALASPLWISGCIFIPGFAKLGLLELRFFSSLHALFLSLSFSFVCFLLFSLWGGGLCLCLFLRFLFRPFSFLSHYFVCSSPLFLVLCLWSSWFGCPNVGCGQWPFKRGLHVGSGLSFFPGCFPDFGLIFTLFLFFSLLCFPICLVGFFSLQSWVCSVVSNGVEKNVADCHFFAATNARSSWLRLAQAGAIFTHSAEVQEGACCFWRICSRRILCRTTKI